MVGCIRGLVQLEGMLHVDQEHLYRILTPFGTVVTPFGTPENRHKSSIFDKVAGILARFFGLKVSSIYLPYNRAKIFCKSYCNQAKFFF